MEAVELEIAGAFLFTPVQHADDRGVFLEFFKSDVFGQTLGHEFGLKQANISQSGRGVIRGIHFADVPPSQAKYVTCVAGAVMDVVVDIRLGSPTFGRWQSVDLNDQNRAALYLSEGLGHGFVALSESATVMYLCSEGYNPERERAINPLDPDLAIAWPTDLAHRLSPKDERAMSFATAQETGQLPTLDDCLAYRHSLGS
mgnify:CR=1 FL=1